MIIHLDSKNLHVQVLCGIKEKFEPTAETDAILEKVEALKAKMEAFRDSVLAPELSKIESLIKEVNSRYTVNK